MTLPVTFGNANPGALGAGLDLHMGWQDLLLQVHGFADIPSAKRPLVNRPLRNIIRIFSRLAGSSAAWLGVAACDPFQGPAMAYGCPCADYKVNGVVSSLSGAPLAGVRMGFFVNDTTPEHRSDSTLTGADGTYALSYSDCGTAPENVTLRLRARDTVQPARYRMRDTSIFIPESALEGADGEWNEGTAVVRVDIVLDTNKTGLDGK